MTKEYGEPPKSSKRKKTLTREGAIEALWRQGKLSWKLKGKQREIYDHFNNTDDNISACLISRQFGKSFTLCLMAIELCLNKPGAVIKYACPTQKMVVGIIKKRIGEIIRDCPDEVKPEWKTQEKIWLFPNGSEIQVAGTDGKSYDNLRGGTADMCVVDEAGFCDELETVIYSVLAPTTDTTGGKIFLASTPNDANPNHDFHELFIHPLAASGKLLKFTYEDSPMVDNKQRALIVARYPGGENNTKFRCEYLCFDENTMVNTLEGFKKIKNIKKDDRVFTHKGNLKSVERVFKNKYDGRNVYKLHNTGLPVTVTEGHEIYVSYDGNIPVWEKVENIDFTRHPYSVIEQHPELSVDQIITEDMAFLAGWYVAEGHHNKTQQQVILSLAKKDPIDEINLVVNNLYGKNLVKYKDDENVVQMGLNSKEAKDFLKPFGRTSSYKKVINSIKYASDHIKMTFLKAYIEGDGHMIERNGRLRIGCNSTSYQLMQDVAEMLYSMNIGCTIKQMHKKGKHIIEGRTVNVNDSWRLYICGSDAERFLGREITKRKSSCIIKDNKIYSRLNKLELIDYDKEYVYDIQVKDDHSYSLGQLMVHNCEIPNVTEANVIPEFSPVEDKIVKEVEIPDHCDFYTSMDLGFKDLTVALFGYYDFKNSRLVIIDEYVINGPELKTDILDKNIKHKEELRFKSTLGVQPAYLRVMDNNNLMLINELARTYDLTFIPTAKHNKEQAVDNVRRWIEQERIVIHPRCKNLIYHVKYAQWQFTRAGTSTGKFRHLKGNDTAGLLTSHADALDALIYMVRNIHTYRNPFPEFYGNELKPNTHVTKNYRENKASQSVDLMRKIMNLKK